MTKPTALGESVIRNQKATISGEWSRPRQAFTIWLCVREAATHLASSTGVVLGSILRGAVSNRCGFD